MKITKDGLLELKFSAKMKFDDFIVADNSRHLRQKNLTAEDLKIEIIPGADSDPEKLGFTWYLDSTSAT
jgi:hypothetical protein